MTFFLMWFLGLAPCYSAARARNPLLPNGPLYLFALFWPVVMAYCWLDFLVDAVHGAIIKWRKRNVR